MAEIFHTGVTAIKYQICVVFASWPSIYAGPPQTLNSLSLLNIKQKGWIFDHYITGTYPNHMLRSGQRWLRPLGGSRSWEITGHFQNLPTC